MSWSSKPTAQPPPDQFIDIHIINENQPSLAKTIRIFLGSQSFAGRIPRINAPGLIPAPVEGAKHKVAVCIVAFDEFTDIPATLLQLGRVYDESVTFIAHIEFENATLSQQLRKSRISQIFVGYDFKALVDIISNVAGQLPYRSKTKRPPAP